MQLISLAAPVRVWPPNASLPVEAVALVGKVDEEGEVRRAEVHALVPPCGGLLTFCTPVVLTLRGSVVTGTQDTVFPVSMPSA